MARREIQVGTAQRGWAVRREVANRDSSHHDRKSDAMDAARHTARRERVEVVKHGRDGRIQDSDSYGRPVPGLRQEALGRIVVEDTLTVIVGGVFVLYVIARRRLPLQEAVDGIPATGQRARRLDACLESRALVTHPAPERGETVR